MGFESINIANSFEQSGVWSYSIGTWGDFFDTTENVDYFVR